MLRSVTAPLKAKRSPTPGLLLGLVVTLAAVVAYTGYITYQIKGLRDLQSNIIDRNRRDSLQLLRIQNDLNLLGIAMRDMLDNTEPYPLSAWAGQFQRIRQDLDDAMRRESGLSVAYRTAEQRNYMEDLMKQFWGAADHMFTLASSGNEAEARRQIRVSLQAHQAALSIAVARQLVANNESEQQAGERIQEIYFRVQRQVLLFLLATLVPIVLTSLYLIRSNRLLFQRLSDLSEQRSELAQKLIATQESTSAAHFAGTARRVRTDPHRHWIDAAAGGAAGAGRIAIARRPGGGIGDCAVDTRQGAQPLAGAASGDAGGGAGWRARWIGISPWWNGRTESSYTTLRRARPSRWKAAWAFMCIECCRRPSTTPRGTRAQKRYGCRLRFREQSLELDVEDHGSGFHSNGKRGIGLVAMRERAELLNGKLEFLHPHGGGTLVRLSVPKEPAEVGV